LQLIQQQNGSKLSQSPPDTNTECQNQSQSQNTTNVDDEIEKILNPLKLTMKPWKTATGMYFIITYDKRGMGVTYEDYKTIGMLRSVVVNEEGQIVCYSPPKSLYVTEELERHFDANNIMTELSEENTNEWYAEEFVEGTMINLFYSSGPSGEAWEIATKNTIGGNALFYSPKNPKEEIEIRESDTFRNMFFDTCAKIGFEYENLPKDVVYSFVLQHPKNRIVLPITEASIYLVAVYRVVNTDDGKLEVIQHSRDGFLKNIMKCDKIKTPKTLSLNEGGGAGSDYTFKNFKKEYASMNSAYNMMGVMFYNMVTGERMKLRNPMYEMVKNVRGSEQKIQLQYLTLRHGGRVADYLKDFPEYKSVFSYHRSQVHSFTRNLHQNYLDCFVFKKKPFAEYPPQYKKHIFVLNKKYIEELRENKNSVTFNYVVEFINRLDPGSLLFSLNYVVKEHKKEIQRLEEPIASDGACDGACEGACEGVSVETSSTPQ
jgi:hypothetical protein